jgi:hypothetical protein
VGTHKPQKWLSSQIDAVRYDALFESLTFDYDRSRFLSLQLPYSSGWLSIPPLVRFSIPHRHYILLLKYRLGIPLSRRVSICPCCKIVDLDRFGHHAASCKFRPGLYTRHNKVRNLLSTSLQKAGFATHLEPLRLLPNLGSGDERPADVLVENFLENGVDLCIDVSIGNPCALSYLSHSSVTKGYVAALLEGAKNAHYAAECAKENLGFLPFVMETFGGFGSCAAKLIKRIGRALQNAEDSSQFDQPLDVEASDLANEASAAKMSNSFANELSFACQVALGNSLAARYPKTAVD